MVAVFNHGDINIDDVAVFEFFTVVGHTMANHMIDRGADRFRVGRIAGGSIVERRGNRALPFDHIVVAEAIDLGSGQTGFNEWCNEIQHLRAQFPGDAHFFDFVR